MSMTNSYKYPLHWKTSTCLPEKVLLQIFNRIYFSKIIQRKYLKCKIKRGFLKSLFGEQYYKYTCNEYYKKNHRYFGITHIYTYLLIVAVVETKSRFRTTSAISTSMKQATRVFRIGYLECSPSLYLYQQDFMRWRCFRVLQVDKQPLLMLQAIKTWTILCIKFSQFTSEETTFRDIVPIGIKIFKDGKREKVKFFLHWYAVVSFGVLISFRIFPLFFFALFSCHVDIKIYSRLAKGKMLTRLKKTSKFGDSSTIWTWETKFWGNPYFESLLGLAKIRTVPYAKKFWNLLRTSFLFCWSFISTHNQDLNWIFS